MGAVEVGGDRARALHADAVDLQCRHRVVGKAERSDGGRMHARQQVGQLVVDAFVLERETRAHAGMGERQRVEAGAVCHRGQAFFAGAGFLVAGFFAAGFLAAALRAGERRLRFGGSSRSLSSLTESRM